MPPSARRCSCPCSSMTRCPRSTRTVSTLAATCSGAPGVLVVCGHIVTEEMKNDIAIAQRLGITATTLEGILTVKGQGKRRRG